MPIVWGVHHATRTVVATARGELRLADIEHYLEGLAAAATLSYRKVFDLAQGRLALSTDEMLALGARVRGLESRGPMGNVAVIATVDEAYQQARLFETFAQADRSLDRSKGGLGLGLSLVKGLAELHGGTVEARSEGAGRGSEFVVRLPLQPEPAAVTDRVADLLPGVPDHDADLADPRRGQGLDPIEEDGLVGDRDELLGGREGDGAEPGAAPAGQDEALHRIAPFISRPIIAVLLSSP